MNQLESAINNDEGHSVLISLGLDASQFAYSYDGSKCFYDSLLALHGPPEEPQSQEQKDEKKLKDEVEQKKKE